MCKYCDVKPDKYRLGLSFGSEIVPEAHYVGASIVKTSKHKYIISVYGDDECFSEPISFCPFCGRKLKE